MIGLIPARGGSKTVLDKNLLSWDGHYPAVISAARVAGDFTDRVYVSTDSDEIAAVAQAHGYLVDWRPEALATDAASIDDLVAFYQAIWGENLLVVLPTAARATPDDVAYLLTLQKTWPHHAVALTRPTHGLIYNAFGDLITPRTNRQKQALEAEVGIRHIPITADPYKYKPVLAPSPIVEIDTPIDLMVARHRPKRITLVYDESTTIGTGHRRRMNAVANELQHHSVQVLKLYEFDPMTQEGEDVVVFDVLDTPRYLVAETAAHSKVVTIEDLGEGARFADMTINALYDPNQVRYADLRPEFWGLRHEGFAADKTSVLVTFGGTDPAGLGMRFSGLLLGNEQLRITTVTPQAPINMAKAMMEHHILITSAGRTLHEAAYVGIPTISIAANIRETTHCHLGPKWGNVYLGHHQQVADDLFLDSFERLLRVEGWRKELTRNRYLDHLGVQRIAKLVERLAED